MKRNPHMIRLKGNYLFPEICLRKEEFLKKHPSASLISLGIGDTTEPLSPFVVEALQEFSSGLATLKGYTGYGPEQGMSSLREKISQFIYNHKIKREEIFISDGTKCDLGRLQMLFGGEVSIAVQDPSYPVYVEGSVIQGVKKIVSMPCFPENDFFPDLNKLSRTDLIYFCSPNNPTGAVATREQLKQLVDFAKGNQSIIIFDAAYSHYIQDSRLPKSIYEIEGAREVAIELNSFSKLAGFTGVRLGWAVVPERLQFDDGYSVLADWNRLTTTLFNGASNIAQRGGYAVLEETGWEETQRTIALYLHNALLIKETLEKLGYEVFGGIHAPYVWVRFKGQNSWDLFQYFLEKYHLISTPGSGFGEEGKEFVRFTGFGHPDTISEAIKRLMSSAQKSGNRLTQSKH